MDMLAGPLMKTVVVLAKNIFAPLNTMASTSGIDYVFQTKYVEEER